jgi:hypothetical protein
MNKIYKLLAVLGLVLVETGCISVNGLAKEQFNDNKNEGVIYGVHFNGGPAKTTKDIVDICNMIENKDSRCSDPKRYVAAPILSKNGFSDGPMGAIAIVDTKNVKLNKPCSFPTSSSCTFYKVKVERNKFATLVELASNPNDGKCKWTGLNGAGGTVCPAYGWDYNKDNQSAIFF